MSKTNETLKSQEKIDRGVIVYTDEQILKGGIKVWRRDSEYTLTMIDGVPSSCKPKDTVDEYDWMWRVFDGEHNFTDIGRRINIDWGSKWTTVFGSKPTRDIWAEDLRRGEFKFYEDQESENADLRDGNWRDVVEAHMKYFSDIITVIMRKHRDSIPVDEATAVAMQAICEFALKLSESDEDLRARFSTSAYSWVRNAYSDAIDQKDVISTRSHRKLRDFRTLNTLIKELKGKLLEGPTIEQICNELGWGERRVESTFRIFDFNLGESRDMNTDEMLYTVMDEHLTERQAKIIEMNFGLNDVKWTMPNIAEELNIGIATAERDKAKALKIIKEELNFKFS